MITFEEKLRLQKLAGIILENKKYGEYLFGGKNSGVKIDWYDEEKEPDTPAEKKLFDLLYNYVNVGPTDDNKGEWSLDSYYNVFQNVKKDYPEILNSNIPNNKPIYRGTSISPNKLNELFKTHKMIKSTIDGKEYIIILDTIYSSRRKISSWTPNFKIAFENFAHDIWREGNYGVIIKAIAGNAELIFNPLFINKLSGNTFNETEIFNMTNPIKVDIIISIKYFQ